VTVIIMYTHQTPPTQYQATPSLTPKGPSLQGEVNQAGTPTSKASPLLRSDVALAGGNL
jgi:hypothetical protein